MATHERRVRATARALALAVAVGGCSIPVHEPRLHEPTAPPADEGKMRSALKVHLKSGAFSSSTRGRRTPVAAG